jgi:uncharacterized protein (TIGR03067 family)
VKRSLFVLAVSLLFATHALLGDKSEKNAEKAELKKWQGTWKVVAAEFRGETQPPPKLKFSFREGDFSVFLDGQEGSGAVFLLDSTASPKRLNMRLGYFTLPGIYSLKDDTLKICLGGGLWQAPSGERPTAFTTKGEGSGVTLLTLKRDKPEAARTRALRREEWSRLQGTWEVIAFKGGDKEDNEDRAVLKGRLTFNGRTLTSCDAGGLPEPAVFLFDPTTRPKKFTMQVGDFLIPTTYRLEGDTLTISMSEGCLMVLRRKKR